MLLMAGQEKSYFLYTDAERDALRKKDKKLARFMELAGDIRREVISDPFAGMAHAIVGQQISSKAHESVWNRFVEAFAPVCPENIAALSPSELAQCGISRRKAGYIHNIALEFVRKSLCPRQLAAMDDESLSARLCALDGVGPWTAEMLMIFTFQRKNILSFGDFAILRGIRMLYGHREVTPAIFARLRARYSPCATLASLYLWELSSGKYAQYRDPAMKSGAIDRKKRNMRKSEK